MRFAIVLTLLVALSLGSLSVAEKAPAGGKGGEPRRIGKSPEATLAIEGAEWMLSKATKTKDGLVWPEYGEHPFTTMSVYSGTPGVLYALLSLYRATGEAKYKTAALDAVKGIRAAAKREGELASWDLAWDDAEDKVHYRESAALYSGTAGNAVALLEAGWVLNLPDATKDGIAGLRWVVEKAEKKDAGLSWTYDFTDIISGNAGIVCALLRGHELTGEAFMLQGALGAGEYLKANATVEKAGLSWGSAVGELGRPYNGFSHGTAGIAWSLAKLAMATGEQKYMDAAMGGVKHLMAVALDDEKGLRWEKSPDEKSTVEGWCHGVSGTARLFMLMGAVTGDKAIADVAVKAAKWLSANYDPKQDRFGSKFYSPSLCCGATGAGEFMLDLYTITGDPAHLEYARSVGDWLSRIADRPKKGEACWSLTPVVSERYKVVMHPTSLMLGSAGHVCFLLRLAAQRAGVLNVPLVTPDKLGMGAPAGLRGAVVMFGPGSERFRNPAIQLAAYRRIALVSIPDGDPARLTVLVKNRRLDSVALVVAPEFLDVNLNRKVIDALCRVDDDPFCDAMYGYLTAETPEHVLAMLDSMARVEAEGIGKNGLYLAVASGTSDMLRYPKGPDHSPLFARTGIENDQLYFSCVDTDPKAREHVAEAVRALSGRGYIHMSGCGDPMRTWLFADQRNMSADKHWKFSPAKVLRKNDHPEMPGFGASDLKGVDISPAVVFTGVCHHGVPLRVFVEGDIVSTFGETDGKCRVVMMKPEESMCLSTIARGPSAYLAPIGPNHGAMASNESYRSAVEDLPLGEAIRRGVNDVVTACLAAGKQSIPLELREENKAEPRHEGMWWLMASNQLNRVLFGDPLFRPFTAVSPRSSALAWTATPSPAGGTVYAVSLTDPNSPEYWDMFRDGGNMRERIAISVPLSTRREPGKLTAVARLGEEKLEIAKSQWSLEQTRSGGWILHLQANGPGGPNYAKNLWREGVTVSFEVEGWKE